MHVRSAGRPHRRNALGPRLGCAVWGSAPCELGLAVCDKVPGCFHPCLRPDYVGVRHRPRAGSIGGCALPCSWRSGGTPRGPSLYALVLIPFGVTMARTRRCSRRRPRDPA